MKGVKDFGLAFNHFLAMETLEIRNCKRFRSELTPTTTNLDTRELTNLIIGFERGEKKTMNWLSIQKQEVRKTSESILIWLSISNYLS